MKNPIKTISANLAYIDPDDTILKVTCEAVACSVYFSKPSKNYSGVFTVKKTDSTATAVTIYPYSGETIDGSASVTLTAQNDYKTFSPVNGGWTVVDAYSGLTVTTTGTQTLTNKTLTTPELNGGTLNAVELVGPYATVTINPHDYDSGTADWTLSTAEKILPIHNPTNASGPVNAIVDITKRPYIFINGTGQNLVVKTASGTGITIANSKAAMVMSDGINVIRLTPDA